jgi:DEAD/DEAH box helicase domain-containing protein
MLHTTQPSDACATLAAMADEPQLMERVVFTSQTPAREPRFAEPTSGLSPELRSCLIRNGITALWEHQARAVDAIRAGRSVVLTTGTASGKSLGYQLPIVESVLEGSQDTALLVYPTKALAQDQLRSLREWLLPDLVASTYDGDTSPDERTWARANATVLLTNPEMLHLAILPSHARWATFLMRLRYVVLDELHVLRGLFGSHVAHVLRRLRRLCAHYGSDPVFCFTSATIGNPAELASELCGLPVEAIGDDAAPRPERTFAVWQRPLLDQHTGARASANLETAMLLSRFVEDGHQTLAFTRSRRSSELVATQARSMLGEVCPPGTAPAVAA